MDGERRWAWEVGGGGQAEVVNVIKWNLIGLLYCEDSPWMFVPVERVPNSRKSIHTVAQL